MKFDKKISHFQGFELFFILFNCQTSVMFPTLCFVDETYDVITEENKEQFREILSEEEYESLLQSMEELKDEQKAGTFHQNNQEIKVFYKLKSVIWLNKVIDYLRK